MLVYAFERPLAKPTCNLVAGRPRGQVVRTAEHRGARPAAWAAAPGGLFARAPLASHCLQEGIGTKAVFSLSPVQDPKLNKEPNRADNGNEADEDKPSRPASVMATLGVTRKKRPQQCQADDRLQQPGASFVIERAEKPVEKGCHKVCCELRHHDLEPPIVARDASRKRGPDFRDWHRSNSAGKCLRFRSQIRRQSGAAGSSCRHPVHAPHRS